MIPPAQIKARAKDERKTNKKFLNRLARQKPKRLDQTVAQLHDEVFEEIDCLVCANCCKTTSPIFIDKDVDRIARHLGLRR